MEKYVERWLQHGLIDSETSKELMKDIESEKIRVLKKRFNIFIYTLATVCVGIGIFFFISANDWILKLFSRRPNVRIISLFCISMFSLIGGISFYEKGSFPRLGRSLIFLSSMLFGISYFQIWEVYHIGHYDIMTLLWLVSILPIAYKFQNIAVNRLSILVFLWGCVQVCMLYGVKNNYNLCFICPILSGSFLYTISGISKRHEEFFTDYSASGFALIFLALLLMSVFEYKSCSVITFVYVPLIFLACCNLYLCNKQLEVFEKRERLLLSFVLLVVICMSAFSKISAAIVTVCVANALMIAILGMGFKRGYKERNQSLIGIMNTCTMIYLILNYCHWGWSRLGNSAFFVVGGMILFGMGIFLEKSRKNAKLD